MDQPVFKLKHFPDVYRNAIADGTFGAKPAPGARFFPSDPSPIFGFMLVVFGGIPLMVPLAACVVCSVGEVLSLKEAPQLSHILIGMLLLAVGFAISTVVFILGFGIVRNFYMDVKETRAAKEGRHHLGLLLDKNYLIAHLPDAMSYTAIAVPRSCVHGAAYEWRRGKNGGYHVMSLKLSVNGMPYDVEIAGSALKVKAQTVIDYIQPWAGDGDPAHDWAYLDKREAEKSRYTGPGEKPSLIAAALSWAVGPLFGWMAGSTATMELTPANWHGRSMTWLILGAVLPIGTGLWHTLVSKEKVWVVVSTVFALTTYPAAARLVSGVTVSEANIAEILCAENPSAQGRSVCLTYQVRLADGTSTTLGWRKAGELKRGMPLRVTRLDDLTLGVESPAAH